MAFTGPHVTPPARVHCIAKESDCGDFSNSHISDKSTFANLLCDLLSEHHRCLRDAAIFAKDMQHTCEPQAPKMSAYIPSPGDFCGESLRMSASDLSAEEQKHFDILQAHVQSAGCPQQEFWQITHPKEVGLKPVCSAAEAEPEQEWDEPSAKKCFQHLQVSSQHVCFSEAEQGQEPNHAQQHVSFTDAEKQEAPGSGPMVSAVQQSKSEEISSTTCSTSSEGARGSNDGNAPQGEHPSVRHPLHHTVVEFFESHKTPPSKDASSWARRPSLSTAFSINSMYPELLSNTAMSDVLNTQCFEFLIGTLIMVNTLIMAAELQYYGMKGGYASKYPTFERQAHEDWPHAEKVFEILERTFTVIFTLELLFRLVVLGRSLFKGALNWMDLVFVVVSWLDWFYEEAGMVNPMMARLVRLVRLCRGVRLAKLPRVVSSLHLLIKCVTSSASILSWSVCILLVAQCISGMMLCQLVQHFVMDENQDLIARQQVFAYYGTFSRSMVTMFEVHLANFGPACRILLDHVGEEYAYVFLAYRCFAGFAIINVINAVFVQQTIKVAESDQDVMLNQKRNAVESYAKKIKAFFHLVDTNGDGCISQDELQAFEENPTYQLWMSALDIEASDLRALFRMIDIDQDGAITADELISGASRIKGPARSVDMVQVLAHLHKINCKLDDCFKPEANNPIAMQTTPSGISQCSRSPMVTDKSESSRVSLLHGRSMML